jgi:hypothetical protein
MGGVTARLCWHGAIPHIDTCLLSNLICRHEAKTNGVCLRDVNNMQAYARIWMVTVTAREHYDIRICEDVQSKPYVTFLINIGSPWLQRSLIVLVLKRPAEI